MCIDPSLSCSEEKDECQSSPDRHQDTIFLSPKTAIIFNENLVKSREKYVIQSSLSLDADWQTIKSDRSLKMSHISVGKSNSNNSNHEDENEFLNQLQFKIEERGVPTFSIEQKSEHLEKNVIDNISGSSLNYNCQKSYLTIQVRSNQCPSFGEIPVKMDNNDNEMINCLGNILIFFCCLKLKRFVRPIHKINQQQVLLFKKSDISA